MKFFKISCVLIILYLFTSYNQALAFGSGSGTCDIADIPTGSMPGRTIHSNVDSRFSISISPNYIVPGQNHQITLTRTSGSGGFRGLLLYAENEGGDRVGTFDVLNTPSVQELDCSATPNSTITHNGSSSFASTFTINWQAPTNITGNIIFSSIVYETSPSFTFNIPTPLAIGLAPKLIPTIGNWSLLLLLLLLFSFGIKRKFN